MTGVKFKVSITGANEVARKFDKTWRDFDHIVSKRMDQAGEFMVEKLFKKAAPKDTGHLRRGISWVKTGQLTINIVGEAIDPESGFDYFDVTRFGHTGPIFPFRAKVLHFFMPGDISPSGHIFPDAEVFAHSTKGFHPLSDWVDRALPNAREVANRTGKLIARDIRQELER